MDEKVSGINKSMKYNLLWLSISLFVLQSVVTLLVFLYSLSQAIYKIFVVANHEGLPNETVMSWYSQTLSQRVYSLLGQRLVAV